MAEKGRTYKATGITLKSMPMGESDRLLTILTKEHGLVRAITPGSRKPKSSLRAISTGFVVGELFIVKGRNLDKLVQADCRASFPGLSRDLGKLTTAQYLAELALGQALSEHPQEELFDALILHLNHIAQRSPDQTLPSLVQGILHFLAIAGIAPQVNQCCVTQVPLLPNMADPNWRVGFDASAGGAIALASTHSPRPTQIYGGDRSSAHSVLGPRRQMGAIAKVTEPTTPYTTSSTAASPSVPIQRKPIPKPILKKTARQIQLDATELKLLQSLSQTNQPVNQQADSPPLTSILEQDATRQNDLTGGVSEQGQESSGIPNTVWLSLERTLRYYAQYHFDQPIRSAALIETCFLETMTH